jgi:DNA repair protein RecN (Recombination protein N)
VLSQITIQGLAIIDQLAIEFSHGFNVITGETGAGKSILIKALGLLLGSKASAETVRRGRDAATVTGLFEAPVTHRCASVLARYAIPMEPEGDRYGILVRRSVNNKGRSLAWINDVPVTVTVLRELAATLIDVFGQHENQRLLDPSQHTAYVDQFLKDKGLLVEFHAAYAGCSERLAALTAMVDEFRSKRRDADYLAFRCDELAKFAPSKEDYEHVQGLALRGGNLLQLMSSLERAQACLDQGADGEALSRPLWEAAKILGKIEAMMPAVRPLADEANAIASRIDDLSYQIGRSVSGNEVDEQDLEAAQERLAGYQELFRKMAVPDIDGLLAERDRLASELQFLESAAADVNALLRGLRDQTDHLTALAARLTKARRKAKDSVRARIETELKELAMPGATIDIEFQPSARPIGAVDVALFGAEAAAVWANVAETMSSLTENGAERAQFLLSSNQGEGLLPLHKVASGGEVSRIMLALKKGLAAGADTCILVFDEIDSGISGRVADVVGRKMQELADSFQVICISHLAQVAAYADTHFLVHKYGKDQRTESTISKLKSRESEEEIARLLSGQEVTPSSLANARQLIRKARAQGAPVEKQTVAPA